MVKERLKKIFAAVVPDFEDLEFILSRENPADLEHIFSFADRVRRQFMGDVITLRGLVEFSNYCRNSCFYCGLNKNNKQLERYRLGKEEILACCEKIYSSGIRTVVLQSGEEDGLDPLWLKGAIEAIKAQFEIAITLSVGERAREEYKIWKDAGADRYLLKIETSNKKLYDSLHANMSFENRLRCLCDLRELGYQVGCGNMIGLKGQTFKNLAEDIVFFKENNFDMIGIGPFIPHPQTRLAPQKKGEVELTLKVLALTRIVTKNAHLPATTALGSLEEDFRIKGLKAGANVLMPNFTPLKYRKLYEIYPGKRCISEEYGDCASITEKLAGSLSRYIDHSRGDSRKQGFFN
jgi:biotin synthase